MKICILRTRTYVSIALMTLGTLAMSSVVCAYSSHIPAGEVSYQWLWSGKMAIIFSVCILMSTILSSNGIIYFQNSLSLGIVLMAGIQSVWGLLQIYDFVSSNHTLYSVTGSFYNPGPYSGYLALAFPICLYEWLYFRELKQKYPKKKIASYFFLGILLLLICILPVGMSRSAWLATFVSTIFVCSMHYKWKLYLKRKWQLKRKRTIGEIILLFIIIFVGGVGIYSLKPDSAKGRLFMWKISCLAIMEKPILGHGAGNFAQAYGRAQEHYFSLDNYSEVEERVAGSPQYAFNEYLRIAVEFGIPVLLIVLGCIAYCLYQGIRHTQFGICGGLLSLLVFSFSSYPMEFPCFIFSFVFLLLACLTDYSRIHWLIFVFVIGSIGIRIINANMYDSCCSWSQCRMLYEVHAYSKANEEYKRLYPLLKNRYRFLFEYGRCLYKQKEYHASISILREAAEMSSDPMILNIIGKNYHLLGEYEKAEEWLTRSTNRLPGRIYPYYLLAKLYAEEDFYQPEKLRSMANIVLTKEPKVHSNAIEEMRIEIRELIEK